MTTIPYDPTQVKAFRSDAQLLGVEIGATDAAKLLRKVKHRGVALDAMLLQPRPAWLKELLKEKKS